MPEEQKINYSLKLSPLYPQTFVRWAWNKLKPPFLRSGLGLIESNCVKHDTKNCTMGYYHNGFHFFTTVYSYSFTVETEVLNFFNFFFLSNYLNVWFTWSNIRFSFLFVSQLSILSYLTQNFVLPKDAIRFRRIKCRVSVVEINILNQLLLSLFEKWKSFFFLYTKSLYKFLSLNPSQLLHILC